MATWKCEYEWINGEDKNGIMNGVEEAIGVNLLFASSVEGTSGIG
jgi:hypothetical protein